jgi:hypothetical protein
MSYENYTHTKLANIPVVYIEVALVVFLLVSYVGLAFHTVYAAGMKERGERALSALSSTVGGIETRYLDLTKSINIERAHTLGFNENIDNTLFLNTNGKITAVLPR